MPNVISRRRRRLRSIALVLIPLALALAGCGADATSHSVIASVQPSPAQPGQLAILQGRGFDGMRALLVAGRSPVRVTPVNDRLIAFILPPDLPPGPATVSVSFAVGPPRTIDVLVAGQSTGTEQLHTSPAPAPGAPPTPAPTETAEAGPPAAPGPWVLPSVVPLPRTEDAGHPGRGGGDDDDEDQDEGGRGNGRGNRPGRGRGR